ncbi:sodium:proton antiporter [Planctomycetales bacterium ZRK34]|nr:sodium:proton antiporter [Planctomycetales bacterium ZRK34]
MAHLLDTATLPLLLAAGGGHVPDVALYWALPFALLLLSIATMPLINAHFWHKYYPHVSFVLGTITAVYYLFFYTQAGVESAEALSMSRSAWLHEMQEYVSFIALLGSLYIVSGGIKIDVRRKATPMTNAAVLLIGAVIANVVGTTGAAMLLIRPYIRINKDHIRPYHIIFFIFLVANCGGCLTPIGDPPLFMGYLKGVPFFWVLLNCWPMWALACILVLAIFYVVDTINAKKATRNAPPDAGEGPAISITGIPNFLFIGLILFAVFQESMFHAGLSIHLLWSREILMGAAIIGSKLITKAKIYLDNEFTYEPIREVALLFVGIFSTMVPALNWLNHNSDKMPLNSAGQYYFVTGSLSAVLDNAPTYLVFLATKQGNIQQHHEAELGAVRFVADKVAKGESATDEQITAYLKEHHAEADVDLKVAVEEIRGAVDMLDKYYHDAVMAGTLTDNQINLAFLIGHSLMALYLVAISVGAVFFGAMTYIGNGPNFMVKSIAESAKINMPSFFGYVVRYSLPILLPTYLVVWVIFFVLKIGV